MNRVIVKSFPEMPADAQAFGVPAAEQAAERSIEVRDAANNGMPVKSTSLASEVRAHRYVALELITPWLHGGLNE